MKFKYILLQALLNQQPNRYRVLSATTPTTSNNSQGVSRTHSSVSRLRTTGAPLSARCSGSRLDLKTSEGVTSMVPRPPSSNFSACASLPLRSASKLRTPRTRPVLPSVVVDIPFPVSLVDDTLNTPRREDFVDNDSHISTHCVDYAVFLLLVLAEYRSVELQAAMEEWYARDLFVHISYMYVSIRIVYEPRKCEPVYF